MAFLSWQLKERRFHSKQKYEMIQMRNRGDKPGDIGKHFDIKSSSRVSTILGQSAKILAEYEENMKENGAGRNQSKRIKLPRYHEVDAAVEEWFTQAINQPNVVIGCPEIKAHALKYATMLEHPDFVASNGWLTNFRARNHISFKTIAGEAGLVDKNVTDDYINNLLPNLLAGYDPRDVFDADETALFYRAQPTKTMIFKNMEANKAKQCKERVTLMLTANMDESEKLKPMIIGKSVSPRCLQGLNRANLPGIYRANANGWMTGLIFKDWLMTLDRKMRSQKRHILLFLDNFSGHSPNKNEAAYELSNIKLAYFPANCTSVIQPMDQGIINTFKIYYRTKIVRRRINSLLFDITSSFFHSGAARYIEV